MVYMYTMKTSLCCLAYLFHLSKVVFRVSVQHHAADLDQRELRLGPHLCIYTVYMCNIGVGRIEECI